MDLSECGGEEGLRSLWGLVLVALDDGADGVEEGFAFLDEVLGVFDVLAVEVVDEVGLGDLVGGVLGHFLQDPFGEVDCGFVGHGRLSENSVGRQLRNY